MSSLPYVPSALGRFLAGCLTAGLLLAAAPAPAAPAPAAAVPTSTALAASQAATEFGRPVTFSARVSAATGTPSGSVAFMDGTVRLGAPVSLNRNGVARFTTSSLGIGTHSVTARYGGAPGFLSSTSAAVAVVVNPIATSLALTGTPNPATVGQKVTFTATLSPAASGVVTFYDGGVPVGTAGVQRNGHASFSTSALAPGSHAMTASYGGNATHAGSTSNSFTQAVNPASTSLALTLTGGTNPSTFGAALAFTATVTPSATGAVTFAEGGAMLATVALNGGQAVFSTSTLGAGVHVLTASYAGDATHAGSSSSPLTQTVNKAGSSTGLALTSGANPSLFGAPLTFTATVTPSASGSVTFADGGTTLATVALNGGQAQFSTSTLGPGSHALTAAYAGDANHNGSASSPLTQTVNPGATSLALTLTGGANPSTFGAALAFTATVTPTATGDVTFTEGGTTLATVALNGGQAVFSTSALGAGVHNLTASFAGDATHAGSSSSPLAQTVNKADSSTSLALTSGANPSMSGAALTFTATVTPSSSGDVTFADGGTTLATVALNGGQAVFNTSTLGPGSHTLTATYAGDANHNGSASSNLAQTVNPASTSLALTLTGGTNPSTFGAALAFTATVTPSASGDVTFAEGGTTLATVAMSGGQAVFSTSTLGAGVHNLTASYAGDATHAGSSSSPLAQTVNKADSSTSLALTGGANPSTSGAALTFTATVTPSGSGDVTFADGGASLATVALNGGQAVFNTSTLGTGSHSLTATYAGDANHNGSASSTLAQTVKPANPLTLIQGGGSVPVPYGTGVTLIAIANPPLSGVNVTFADNGTPVGDPVAMFNGVAIFGASTLSVGTHSFTASYPATATRSGATSDPCTVVVQAGKFHLQPDEAMAASRILHTTTLLADGRVLVAGGIDPGTGAWLDSAEIHDGSTTPPTVTTLTLAEARARHSATLLGDGTVLLAGGTNAGGFAGSLEILDPVRGTSTAVTPAGLTHRAGHAAALLQDGSVLLAGGAGDGGGALQDAQVFLPGPVPTLTSASMAVPRLAPSATLLPDGTVLVAGGASVAGNGAELYTPAGTPGAAGTFQGLSTPGIGSTWLQPTAVLDARTTPSSPTVYFFGGSDGSNPLASVWAYRGGTFLPLPDLGTPRFSPSATLLPDGRILVAGGAAQDGTPALSTGEIFDPTQPSSPTLALVSTLQTPRAGHTGVLLRSGELFFSGSDATVELFNPQDIDGSPQVPVVPAFSLSGIPATDKDPAAARVQAAIQLAQPEGGEAPFWQLTRALPVSGLGSTNLLYRYTTGVAPGDTVTVDALVLSSLGIPFHAGASTVIAPSLPAIAITAPAAVPISRGSAVTFQASVAPVGGSLPGDSVYTWTLSDPSVSYTGAGTGTITLTAPATPESLTLSCSVYSAGLNESAIAPPVTVSVTDGPLITAFGADRGYLTVGTADTSTLSWTLAGGTVAGLSYTFTPPGGTASGPTALSVAPGATSLAVHPDQLGSYTYALTAGNGSSTTAPSLATIQVVAAPAISAFSVTQGLPQFPSDRRANATFSGGTGAILVAEAGNVPQAITSGVPLALGIAYNTLVTLVVTNPAGASTSQSVLVPGIPPGQQAQGFALMPSAAMAAPRTQHTATLLADGRVLLAGGVNFGASGFQNVNPAEFWSPSGSTPAGTLNHPRTFHTATLLPDGTVLVAGGNDVTQPASSSMITTAERFDPVAGTFSDLPQSIRHARYRHTATLLPNGKVLLFGGRITGLPSPASMPGPEIYDPATQSFSDAGTGNQAPGPALPPAMGRYLHAALLTDTGQVLIAGGTQDGTNALGSTILYDPATDTFTAGFPMVSPRFGLTLVPDQRSFPYVWLGGGLPSGTSFAPPWGDLEFGDFTSLGPFGGSSAFLSEGRAYPFGLFLADGEVLVAGGINANGQSLTSVDVHLPGHTGQFQPLGQNLQVGRHQGTATLIPPADPNVASDPGRVLFAGGSHLGALPTDSITATTELYVPGGSGFLPTVLGAGIQFDPLAGTGTATAPGQFGPSGSYQYFWTTPDGAITSGAGTPQIQFTLNSTTQSITLDLLVVDAMGIPNHARYTYSHP